MAVNGINRGMHGMQSAPAADAAMKRTHVHDRTGESIEDQMNVPEAEIKTDSAGNTPYTEAATVEISDEGEEALKDSEAITESGDRAEASYSKGMSADDRARMLEELKKADEAKQQQLIDMIRKMFDKQGLAYNNANKWKLLASGNYSVDSATAARARADIGEDGYWGVKQTSQRLYDFAYAYAGDDVEKMQKMEKAMEKGFKMAGGQWGKKLPGICYATMDAARDKFKQYYADHGVNTDNK